MEKMMDQVKGRKLERSPLKLVRSILYKVVTEYKDYYILENAYASDYDGRIDLLSVNKDAYELDKKLGKRTEEVAFRDAKDYIQKYIVKEYKHDLS